MSSLYHYFYAGILYVKEFNSIIINDINKKDFSVNINRFKAAKNIIFMNSVNERTVKIAFDQTIIIGLVILRLEIITKREEMELFGLL